MKLLENYSRMIVDMHAEKYVQDFSNDYKMLTPNS